MKMQCDVRVSKKITFQYEKNTPKMPVAQKDEINNVKSLKGWTL